MIKKIFRNQGRLFLTLPVIMTAIATALFVLFSILSVFFFDGKTAKSLLIFFNNMSEYIIIISVVFLLGVAVFLEFTDTLFEMTEVTIKQRIFAKIAIIFCAVTLIVFILMLETTLLDLVVCIKYKAYRNTITVDNLMLSANNRSILSWLFPFSVSIFALLIYTIFLPSVRVLREKSGISGIVLAVIMFIFFSILQLFLIGIIRDWANFLDFGSTELGHFIPQDFAHFMSNDSFCFIFALPIFNLIYLLLTVLAMVFSVFLSIKIKERKENE